MVPQVTALLKHAAAAIQLAFKEHFKPWGCFVPDLDSLVPVVWYSRETFCVALNDILVIRFLWMLIVLHLKLSLSFVELFLSFHFLNLFPFKRLPKLDIIITNLCWGFWSLDFLWIFWLDQIFNPLSLLDQRLCRCSLSTIPYVFVIDLWSRAMSSSKER